MIKFLDRGNNEVMKEGRERNGGGRNVYYR